jgi:chromosome segregation ATPase
MSVDKLEEEKDKLLEQIDELEEKCDTLDLCEEDDGCKKCETYTKIEGLAANVEEIEAKIEELMPSEEDMEV